MNKYWFGLLALTYGGQLSSLGCLREGPTQVVYVRWLVTSRAAFKTLAPFSAAQFFSCTSWSWQGLWLIISPVSKSCSPRLTSSASFPKIENSNQRRRPQRGQVNTQSVTLSGLSWYDWSWAWLWLPRSSSRCTVCSQWSSALWLLSSSLALRSRSQIRKWEAWSCSVSGKRWW
jgi:hypothetical protein